MNGVPFVVGLGSNIEPREKHLLHALSALQHIPQTVLSSWSSVYETDPVGYTDQDLFLNMVVQGTTELDPQFLWKHTAFIEEQMGRKRHQKWGPRNIDIDILFYDHIILETEHLRIPHPRIKERAFVMVPLAEMIPDWTFPDEPITIAKKCEQLQGEGVRKWKKSFKLGPDGFELSAN